MLQDKSAGFAETFNFLERRIDEAATLNKVLEQSDEVSANMKNAVRSVFSTVRISKLLLIGSKKVFFLPQARNIIGLNFQRR